jgi:hypothetical protein
MTAEFDWWLLIVGLVAGAGLVWLILAEWPRRDEELEDDEVAVEAGWIAAQLRAAGRIVEPDMAEAVLRQHRAYLGLPPPDELSPAASPVEAPLAPTSVTRPESDSGPAALEPSVPPAEPRQPPTDTPMARPTP